MFAHSWSSALRRHCIPDYILKDEKLVAQLPVFFRTISGQKPSREDLEKLVELIRSANRP